jgi:transposase
MDPPVTPPLSERKPGEEIKTKHKEAIRQLYKFAKIGLQQLEGYYNLADSTVRKILQYDIPERVRPTRTGRPRESLNAQEVRDVIKYISMDHLTRQLNWLQLREELKLKCSPTTLKRRCNEAGYYSCIECQKPYLSRAQADARWIWAITYMFWGIWEWSRILWSNKVTFLVGGKKCKQRCIRNKKERCHPDCIQFQMHRGHTTPVHFFGTIGYGYKSLLVQIHGSGKNGAFKQSDYLTQVLEPYIQGFLEAFRAICGVPQFMEDGNSAHGHKSITNPCAVWRASKGIGLFPHPAISPDMNPIEKCWRWIKQALHRRQKQPTNEVEMVAAVFEEWDKIPQEWINRLIEKQEYWVHELVKRRGWSTPN